jgi:hypothetical protein
VKINIWGMKKPLIILLKVKLRKKTPQSSVKAMKKLRESVADDKIVASVKSKENTARPEGQKNTYPDKIGMERPDKMSEYSWHKKGPMRIAQ